MRETPPEGYSEEWIDEWAENYFRHWRSPSRTAYEPSWEVAAAAPPYGLSCLEVGHSRPEGGIADLGRELLKATLRSVARSLPVVGRKCLHSVSRLACASHGASDPEKRNQTGSHL